MVSRVTCALRVRTFGGARLLPRKLHARRRFATAIQLANLLKITGMQPHMLNIILEVVDACAACRAWSNTSPASVPSADMADTFNHQTEAVILFVYKFMILHVVDRCTRWRAARVVTSKEETAS